jgi:hypothetical protein
MNWLSAIGDWLSVFDKPFVEASLGAVWVFAFAIVRENNAVKKRFWGKGKSIEKASFEKGILKQNV